MLDQGSTGHVDGQLGLGEQMADRTVAGLDVGGLERTADTVAVPAVVEARPMAPARRRVEARSAQHQRRVKRDNRGYQELACEPGHEDQWAQRSNR